MITEPTDSLAPSEYEKNGLEIGLTLHPLFSASKLSVRSQMQADHSFTLPPLGRAIRVRSDPYPITPRSPFLNILTSLRLPIPPHDLESSLAMLD